MMALVLLTVAFMFVAQIFLFDQNYINSAVNNLKSNVEELKERYADSDLAYNQEFMIVLGLTVNGKMLLVDNQGNLTGAYSMGHPLDLDNDSSIESAWNSVQNSTFYQKALNQESFIQTQTFGSKLTWVYIGIPVKYKEQSAFVILNHSLSDIYTILDVNRRQLILLAISLTIVASFLAALASQRFTKPIFIIKNTVDNLAMGNLKSKPGLNRKDELGKLSDSVEVLGQELQRVDVLRKEVIANVSHELRSPLSIIAGYAEMVRDITWSVDQKREETLNLIISESKRMAVMVNDILDYSQLQAGYLKLKIDKYNLFEIVESSVINCEKCAYESNINIELETISNDIPVSVDALKISQVMRNLLNNAINHTIDGDKITVKISEIESGVRVSVINPGEEIPEEERKVIWERYQRSQHQGGRNHGTGIGLSIVSSILKAHKLPYGMDWCNGRTIFWFEYQENIKKSR